MIAVSLISLVDDDQFIRESIPDLLRQSGYAVRAFATPQEFLSSDALNQTHCLLLDVAMPGMSGPDLQRELQRRGIRIPIVFITGQPTEPLRRKLLALGAVDFLVKPFTDSTLLEALKKALGEN